ncbi:methyl-accepting chemotaxis protein [Vibrio astriarenae]
MNVFNINISRAVLMSFISFIVAICSIGYLFTDQFRQTQNTIKIVTDETFPIMSKVTDISELMAEIENATNQALFSQTEQDVEQWSTAIKLDIAKLNTLLVDEVISIDSISKQSEQLIDNHKALLSLSYELNDLNAALQVMAQRFSVLTGQQYEDELTNEQSLLLTSLVEEFSSMQIETIKILNSQDAKKIAKVLELNHQSREYILEDFSEYSQLSESMTDQGGHELTANLPWLLDTMTKESGIVGVHLKRVRLLTQHNQQLLSFRKDLAQQRELIQQNVDASRIETVNQLDSTLMSIDNVIQRMMVAILVVIVLIVGLCWWLYRSINSPMKSIIATLNRVANGDLSNPCQYNKHNEFGEISKHLNQALDNQLNLVNSIIENNKKITLSSDNNATLGETLAQQAVDQTDLCTSVTQAMKEMDLSVKEISESAEGASVAVQQISVNVGHSVEVSSSAYQQGCELSEQLSQASKAMEKVNRGSQSIVSILEVINSITEQTNLLALNAAIEAARAGESGRGFAVVADEVRQLAKRTSDSTVEIQQVISDLQSDIQNTGEELTSCNERMSLNMSSFKEIQQQIDEVSQGVVKLSEVNRVVSVSTTQQSSVCFNVSQDMQAILNAAEKVKDTTEALKRNSNDLQGVANTQQALVNQFRSQS